MVWQYINFPILATKKGTFTYSYSNPGIGRNQMMCCCRSQIASDYMKFCFNPLCLVYVPAPSFSYPSLITTRVHSYTWYTRVSQNNFLRQNIWHSSFLKIFPNLLFSAALRPYIFATPSAKNALLFPPLNTWESFPDFSFTIAFSPFPNECQLFMPKDFLEPPCLTLLGEPLVLRERVEGGKQITSPLPQFYCPLSPNS